MLCICKFRRILHRQNKKDLNDNPLMYSHHLGVNMKKSFAFYNDLKTKQKIIIVHITESFQNILPMSVIKIYAHSVNYTSVSEMVLFVVLLLAIVVCVLKGWFMYAFVRGVLLSRVWIRRNFHILPIGCFSFEFLHLDDDSWEYFHQVMTFLTSCFCYCQRLTLSHVFAVLFHGPFIFSWKFGHECGLLVKRVISELIMKRFGEE